MKNSWPNPSIARTATGKPVAGITSTLSSMIVIPSPFPYGWCSGMAEMAPPGQPHAPAAYNLAQGRWHRLKTSLIQSVKEASWVLLETRLATYKGCHR
jgi:hypothetical protein